MALKKGQWKSFELLLPRASPVLGGRAFGATGSKLTLPTLCPGGRCWVSRTLQGRAEGRLGIQKSVPRPPKHLPRFSQCWLGGKGIKQTRCNLGVKKWLRPALWIAARPLSRRLRLVLRQNGQEVEVLPCLCPNVNSKVGIPLVCIPVLIIRPGL